MLVENCFFHHVPDPVDMSPPPSCGGYFFLARLWFSMRTVCAPGLLMVCSFGAISTTHGEVIDSAAASNRVIAAAADCVGGGCFD